MSEEKKHEGLPVPGYRPQSDMAVNQVKLHKVLEEQMLRVLDGLRNSPEVDGRWLAIGRTDLEKAFMSINRAIFKPGRVNLQATPKPDEAKPEAAKPADLPAEAKPE